MTLNSWFNQIEHNFRCSQAERAFDAGRAGTSRYIFDDCEIRLRRKRLHASPFSAHPSRMLLELQPPGAILLYAFRAVVPVSGKRTRSRCVAERHEIAAWHERWEIIGGAVGRVPSGVMFCPSSK